MSALGSEESRGQWEKSPTGSVVTRVPMVWFVDSCNKVSKGKLERSPDEKNDMYGLKMRD